MDQPDDGFQTIGSQKGKLKDIRCDPALRHSRSQDAKLSHDIRGGDVTQQHS